MRFDQRELKPYAEPITTNLLKEGEAYFSIQYADERTLIPIVETWIYAGRNLDPKDAENRLYFQDVESYLQGIRYGSAVDETAKFQLASEQNINHIFEYEHAVEEFLKCSLRRRKLMG